MMERFTDSQTWYIIFDKGYGPKGWWDLFLHPKFRHVHIVREINGQAVMVNQFLHALAVREYPNSIEDFITQELNQKPTALLQYTVHYGAHYLPSHIEPLTCVTVAKRILGIRKRILTPKALYHELIKAGAHVILPYCVV